jgi:hypothetical protein
MLTKDEYQVTYKHNFGHISLKLLKRMENPNKLDAVESKYIYRANTGNWINRDEGPLT